MAATDFADRSVGLSSGVKANIPMTREALVLGWCMAEPHARNQLAMLGLFILYLGAHVPGRAIGQLAAEAALLGPGHVLTWVCQLAHPQICALRARARARPTFSCLLIINCPKLLFTQDAAAWFSVGPVAEFARWVGLGGLDWVMALVVFLGLLHLAVEVTSSLRRN